MEGLTNAETDRPKASPKAFMVSKPMHKHRVGSGRPARTPQLRYGDFPDHSFSVRATVYRHLGIDRLALARGTLCLHTRCLSKSEVCVHAAINHIVRNLSCDVWRCSEQVCSQLVVRKRFKTIQNICTREETRKRLAGSQVKP